MDSIYRYYAWFILCLSIIAYLVFYTLTFNGTIEQAINDWRNWVHLVFVTYLNVVMAGSAFDSGLQWGLVSDEFEEADKLNNKLIKDVKNNKKQFRDFIKELNREELETVREDFLFNVGDKTYDDLTDKEKRKYNRLKAVRHDIDGFDMPLYYTITSNGKVNYNASINVGRRKTWTMIQRAFGGLLFGTMTVNVTFALGNLSSAFASMFVIIAGLFITFILIAFPQYFKLKNIVPKKVIMKYNLWQTYQERIIKDAH